jgi:membrane peptidoglycan carboxypeptidase
MQKLHLRFSAREIQTIYLNESYFGQDAIGIAQAARNLIHKDVKDLNLSDSALLVGLLRSPGRYSPSKYPDSAKARRNSILDLMAAQNLISADDAERAKADPVPAS